MKEKRIIKCGFCKKEIDYKPLSKISMRIGHAVLLICPHCKSILGVY